MALQELGTEAEWETFFTTNLKTSKEVSKKYAKSFVSEGYCGESIKHLLMYAPRGVPAAALLALGVKAGHCLKLAVCLNPPQNTTNNTSNQGVKLKIPRPVIALDANQTDFDQFCFEWRTYRIHYQLSPSDIASHLFYCGTEDVRRRIRIEQPSFISSTQYSEADLLNLLKDIVLSKISKIVHIKQFRDIHQGTNESSSEFLARLQLKTSCYLFTCNSCGESGTTERVKEQFILGLSNKTIQTAVLKTESVTPGTPLDKLLAEAMTLEQSIHDQRILKTETHTDNLFSLDNESISGSDSEQQVKALSKQWKQNRSKKGSIPCSGCGKANHGTNEREKKCPAWGKKCFTCGVMNHFSSVCRSQRGSKRTNDNGKHSTNLVEMTCMSAGDPRSNFIHVKAAPVLKRETKLPVKALSAFPDTGANICLVGPAQLHTLGMNPQLLTTCSAKIAVAGGSYIQATGKFQLMIHLDEQSTEQTIYYSRKADRFFLSRQACIGLGIIPSSFPYPPRKPEVTKEVSFVQDGHLTHKPGVIPYQPTPENIPKLEQFLIRTFAKSAFNRSKPFPKLSTPPAHIHLKPNHVVPKPAYWPATVAEHWADEVRASIEKDVDAGILVKVPFNEPTIWCARMVVVKKKEW